MAQTSDRVSSIAARYASVTPGTLRARLDEDATGTAGDIKAMAASLLRQDETKGLRAKVKRLFGR